MGREHLCAYQDFERKIRHDNKLMPDESLAERDEHYRKARSVESLAIVSDHLHFSRVSNWGLLRKSIIDGFINEITYRAGI